ncbi:MAG: methyltransferase domain-containing protein [Alphaproteobacteria bacterium]
MAYESQYSNAVLESMQSVYGEGFLSPGGAEEVGDIVDGLALEGREVLDLGCGIGGATLVLARDLGAGRVLGIDVEEASLALAAAAVESAGLADRIAFELVEPGPLPLPDGRFDLVFSKDVFCHVPDKAPLLGEAFRILRPDGVFASGDWIKGPDGPGSEAYGDWAGRLHATGLRFYFEPIEVYIASLEAAGFEGIEVRDHSAWSERESRRQLDHALGPACDALRGALGEDGLEMRIRLTEARCEALAGGALRHYHLRALRPA